MRVSTQIYIIHDGNWLMLLRNKKSNDVNHDKWIAVGGKLEKDESIGQCAKREMKEETGFTADELVLQGIVEFHYPHLEDELIYVYTCSRFHGTCTECSEGTLAWIKEEDILSLNLWEGDRIFLKKMLAHEEQTFHLKLYYNDHDVLIDVQSMGEI